MQVFNNFFLMLSIFLRQWRFLYPLCLREFFRLMTCLTVCMLPSIFNIWYIHITDGIRSRHNRLCRIQQVV